MTAPALPNPIVSVPLALLISIGIGVGSAYLATETQEAMLVERLGATEKRVESVQTELKGYVAGPQFSTAIDDVKRELDEIRSDVKEIRRGIVRR